MNRRDFLRISSLAAPTLGIARLSLAAQSSTGTGTQYGGAGWRTYEVTTSVNVLNPAGKTRIWLPLPLASDTYFQKTVASSVQCEGGETFLHEDRLTGLKMLGATFPAGTPPVLRTIQRVSTRDWSVDVNSGVESSAAENHPIPPSAADFLKPTEYVPTGGIVKEKADEITVGAHTDIEKTHAIYDWIVRNTYRNPKARGCGVGDIRPMLELGDLGGKCADLNGLFVGLIKASGVPARDVYGIRVGPSALACSSLGTSSDVSTKAQHCRAEVYFKGVGWVPMDPADVRKVILEEPPKTLSLSDPKVKLVGRRLFGSWEMNWIAYNYAQDVALPGSSRAKLNFFMYPQAETEEGRLDCLDPGSFHYEITSREVTRERG